MDYFLRVAIITVTKFKHTSNNNNDNFHSIQQSLDSHDYIELEGAIFASYRLSAESA